ncbi:MAG: SDR family oxidoreductase [Candidatus Omnitrophica bacterium]|nr:SDR family oxidoreductase [Candidatus Omnitrophota bacterium]
MKAKRKTILVLGGTGYVGGRLVPKLLEEGYRVKASGRSKEKLKSRFWANHPLVELVEVDIHNTESLRSALQGVDIAFYLVHSMNPESRDFQDADRRAAEKMAVLSEECGVQRIIYLGGLGDDEASLSKHLKSRREVETVLAQGRVPVTVLRAAMIIGSGSASFEILRYLVERLPLMITPRWVKTPNQPIAIRNVVQYLFGCIESAETTGKTFDIGGRDVLSYLELMRIYAEEAGLRKRFIIPVPVLTPRLSSLWIHLVTPVPSYIARPLAEGLRNPVVCKDRRIEELIPQELFDCREAIRRALNLVYSNDIKSHWTDAGKVPEYASLQMGDPQWAGGTIFEDGRLRTVHANTQQVGHVISRIGGKTGWYHGTWLWVLRGFIDRIVGGVGASRGRRDDDHISVGDVLDFWRVIQADPEQELKLSAEMKLPGEATLAFKIRPIDNKTCELVQHARFKPHGLAGIGYWYILIPLHEYIFGGMIKKISRISEEIAHDQNNILETQNCC